jgi:hypothetical protein
MGVKHSIKLIAQIVHTQVFSERMKLILRSCVNKNENRYPKLARVTPKERTITMNKKDYNEKCKVSVEEHKIDLEMLIQSYANLDKQVGKYAYLKKKFEHSGILNESNIYEFNTVIQKRNVIEQVLKSEYKLSVDDIKSGIKDMSVLISQSCCNELVNLINTNDFEIVS